MSGMLENRVAIVTGAAAHIGRAVALTMAREGACVALADYNAEMLEAVRQEVLQITPNVIAEICDVSDEACVDGVVEHVLNRFGHVDILVNNAGLWRCDIGPFAESKSSFWKKKIDVNILGTMYFSRAVVNSMIEQKYGRIINIASVSGVYGIRNMVDYSMTKGAVISFSLALAKELAGFGITVNSVSPGNVREDTGPDNLNLSFIPRSGTPQENADLICYLASDKAAYISGQNILIDGCRKSM